MTISTAKKINGTFIDFQHHSKPEGIYWNPACEQFTAQDWDAKIQEIAETGMEYIVLMAVALDFKAFCKTSIYPNAGLACEDPLEAVLTASDKYGIKFFIGTGFYGDWTKLHNCFADQELMKTRILGMEELVKHYGHHKSFFGWYYPDEQCIDPYFEDVFINYVNRISEVARRITPDKKIMIAPYGTRLLTPDGRYVQQLKKLDVDIIAYQDEVGVKKSREDETAAFYEGLRKAHDQVPGVALWADVEVFDFEGKVYESALIPAPFSRVERQLEAISPYVDEILIYQYLGMMNKPGSAAFAGHPDSTMLYTDYMNWKSV